MAVMTLDFCSRELQMSTLLTVIVPDSTRIGQTPLSERKCLYLLHGLSDDATAWLRFSKVELYAQETGIVVVMPSVGRSLYCDGVLGQNYFSHVADEIPEYLGLLFGLSRKKEDNFIAGLSMGGMGAARVALTYPERFTAAGLFSGVLELRMIPPSDEHKIFYPFLNDSHNVIDMLDAKKHKGLKLIVRCGMQDEPFYQMGMAFCEKAKGLGLDVTGTFEEGGHVWRLWDRYVEDFINMMVE